MTMLLVEEFRTNNNSCDGNNETQDDTVIVQTPSCSREGCKDFGASISMSNIQLESPEKRGGRRRLEDDDRTSSYPLFQSISLYSPLDSGTSPNADLYNQSQFRKSVSFDNMFLVEIGDAINSDDEGDNDDYINEGSDSCQSNMMCSPTDMMMNELGRKSLSSLKTAKTYTDTTCSRSSCTFAYYGDEDDEDENNNDELLADNQLVKLVSSDGSCLKPIRSVIFDDECNYQIYMIESYKEIPESCDLFLSEDELEQIKRSNESAAYHMIDQHEDGVKHTDVHDNDDDDETVRGLEYVSEIGKWKRYEYIRDSTNAVILLQASYEMSKMIQTSSDAFKSDEEIAQEIAKMYQKETVQAVQEAYQRGLDDYVELFSCHEKKSQKVNTVTSTTQDEQQQVIENETVVNNDNNVPTMTPTVDCSPITKPTPKKSSFLDDSSSDSDDSSDDNDDDDSESYEDLVRRMRLTSSPVKQLLLNKGTTNTSNIESQVPDPSATRNTKNMSSSDASDDDDDSSCSSSDSCDDDDYDDKKGKAHVNACNKPMKTSFDTIQKTSTATTTDCNDSFSSCDEDDDEDDFSSSSESNSSNESRSYACTIIAQASVKCLEGEKMVHATKNAIPARPVRKSCFKSLRCTSTGTTTLSDRPNTPKKSVVFEEPIVSCTEFVSLIKDIPKDVYAEIWWTHEEMLQLRQEYEGLLYMIDQNMSYDEMAESARGLEIRTEEGEWKFYEHKRDAWNAVLGLQDDYMYKNKGCSTTNNLDEMISQAYIEEGSARKTREEALQRAIDDYEAIQDYLSDM